MWQHFSVDQSTGLTSHWHKKFLRGVLHYLNLRTCTSKVVLYLQRSTFWQVPYLHFYLNIKSVQFCNITKCWAPAAPLHKCTSLHTYVSTCQFWNSWLGRQIKNCDLSTPERNDTAYSTFISRELHLWVVKQEKNAGHTHCTHRLMHTLIHTGKTCLWIRTLHWNSWP